MQGYFNQEPIIITGGCGFIGSNLAIRLVELGARVTIIDSMEESCGGNEFNLQSVREKLSVVRARINELEKIRDAVAGAKIIFNLAGKTSHIESSQFPGTDFELNCSSHVEFLLLCKEVNPSVRIIYAGTRQIYGNPRYLPVDEEHPVVPKDINGLNKYCAEKYHNLFHQLYDLPATVLRLTNTYGPRQLIKHNRYGVTGWLTNRALLGEELIVYDDGTLLRDFTYVDDAVEAFIAVSRNNKAIGQIYNIGGMKASLREFAETLLLLSGRGQLKTCPLPKEIKEIGVGNYYADYSKISKDVGWKPETNLMDGLRTSLEFFSLHKKLYIL